jgi:hypothetical protein
VLSAEQAREGLAVLAEAFRESAGEVA